MSLDQRIFDTTTELLEEHGLYGWSVKLTQAYREIGKCNYTHKVINISLKIARVSPWEDVLDTILHEVAHAIAGPGKGHGAEWRHIARNLGIMNPSPYGQFDETKIDPWVGTCSQGHTITMARAPQRVRYCALCMKGKDFDSQHIFQWNKNGHTIPMPKRYQQELHRIMAREARNATVQSSHEAFLSRIDELVEAQRSAAAQ